MLDKGDKVSLFVTVVEAHGKVCRIWAQANADLGLQVENLMLGVEQDQTLQPVVLQSITVGDVFLAKFHEDGSWYRAKVKSVDKDAQQITVFFIDFGNEETVGIGDIASGHSRYFEIPPQASQYFLGDIQAKNGYEWTNIELRGLREQLVNGEFIGIVLNAGTVGNPPTLRVFTDEGQRETVVTTAIAAGFGCRATICMEPPLAQSLLKPSRCYHVYVVFYDSPLNFWIQPVDSEAQLSDLQTSIEAEITDASPPAQHVTLGTVCIAKYIDTVGGYETFYRALVTSVNPDGTCSVLYVDYGNTETLHINQLKAIAPRFKEVPSQAIQCCLHGALSSADDFHKMLESEDIYATVTSVMDSGLHVVTLTEGPSPTVPVGTSQSSSLKRQQSTQQQATPAPPIQNNRMSNNNIYMSYKPLQFNVGNHIDLCISHVEPTGKFYCQLLENASRLQKLMTSLQQRYGSGRGHPLSQSTPGTPCATRSIVDKGLIYRSKIISHGGGSVTVQHVDFGLCEDVPPSYVFQMEEQLMELPSHAIYCTLAQSEASSPNVVASLLREYESKTALVGGVMLKSGQSYEMELVDTSGIKDVYLLHRLQNAHNNNQSTKPAYNKVMLQEGQWIDVQVTFIEDPTRVYCQFVGAQMELNALMLEIDGHCSSGKAQRLIGQDTGTPCLARYSEDIQWYRAVITGQAQSGFDVFFVDYGNKETVQEDGLRMITQDFLTLPKQCFRGVLDGLVGPPQSWTEHDINQLFELLGDDSHPSLIMKHELHDDLYTIQMYKETGLCINHQFGVATRKLSPNFVPKGLPRSKHASTASSPRNSASGGSRVSNGLRSPPSQGWAKWETGGRVDVCKVKPLEVASGFKDILVESIISPDEFYCQLSENNDTLTQFMDQLNAEYNQLGPYELTLQNPQVGDLCIAQFQGDWYRAKMIQVSPDNITVQYLDFGNKETLPASQIRQMKPKLAALPAQALKCALASVVPVAGGKWDQQVTDLLEEIIGDDTVVGAFTGLGTDGKYLIEVIKNIKGGQILVHEELIRKGFAVSREPELVHHTQTRPHQGKSSSVQPTSRNHPSSQTTPIYTRPEVRVGQTVDVNVVHVETPAEFWVHLTQHCAQLEDLMGQIQEFYGSLRPNQLRVSTLKEGMTIVARFSEDQAFYRAEVVRVHSHQGRGKVAVRFVDYGNHEDRTMNDVWEMQVQFMDFPAQALRCSLSGVVPPPTGWSATSKDIFEELVLDKNLLAEIVSVPPSMGMTVRLCEAEGRRSVADQLIQRKVAAAAAPIKPLTINQSFPNSGGRPTTIGAAFQSSSCPQQQQLVNKDLPPQDIAIGDIVTVNIVWTTSPTNFYCQRVESADMISQLMSRLNDHYDCLRMKDAEIHSPQPGQLCVALFNEDGNWYRSRVLRTHNREAEVLYLDFGNTAKISWSKLKVIKPEFLDVPQLAIHCALKGMEACGGTYTTATEEYFMHIMDQDMKLKIEALSTAKGKANTVSLTDPSGKDVSSHILQIEGKSSVPSHNQDIPQPKPSKNSTSSQQQMAPPRTPPRSQQPPVESYRQLNTPLRPGSHPVELTVSNIESAQSFYGQLTNNQAELEEFMEKLHSHYSTKEIPSLTAMQIKKGMPCVALFSEDQFWYRAQVQDYQNPRKINVLFVDYGNAENTTIDKVKPLDHQFASYAVQAFPCVLSGVVAEKTEAAVRLFRELVEEKALQGKIKSSGTPVEVELFDPANKINVNQEMISKFGSTSKCIEMRLAQPKIPTVDTEVYISHVDSPSSFWVQRASDETNIADFATNMSNKYNSYSELEEKLETCTVDAICAAKFSEDGEWYRGVVEAMTGDQATVRFVDYGNADTSSVKDLKHITPDVTTVPPFAIHCTLQGVAAPPGGWTQEQIDRLLGFESVLVATFAPGGDPVRVKLKCDSADVGEELGLPESSTTKSLTRYDTRKPPTAPVSVYAIHIEGGFVYIQLAKEAEGVEAFSEMLQDKYNTISAGDLNLEAVEVGCACVAKFSEDAAWYRATVESVTDQDIKVRFIDFGNAETTNLSQCKKPLPELLEQPPFVFCCTIEGIPPPDGGFSNSITETLEGLILDVELTAQFVTTHEPFAVSLKIEGRDVAEMLAEIHPGLSSSSAVTEMASQPTEVSSPAESEDKVGGLCPMFPEQNTPNEPCTAVMCHVESPDCFYLQLASDFDRLEEMTETLQNIAGEQKLVESVSIGQACCSLFSEDEAWYRAIVEDKLPNSQVKVRFVDFGNGEVKSMDSLKELTSDLLNTPAFAYRCSLHGVVSPQGDWSDEIKTKMEEMLIDQDLEAEFVSETEPFSVRIKVGEEDIATTLSALLPTVSTITTIDMATTPSEVTVSVESEETAVSIPKSELKCGDRVFVSSVDSASHFYLQKESEADELEEFMIKVSATCEAESSPLTNPVVGQTCCAKFSEDEQWYRAIITEITDGAKISVRFSDYGNSDTVENCNVIPLPAALVHQRAFAAPCQLKGAPTSTWTNDQTERFTALTSDKALRIEELDRPHDNNVDSVRLLDGEIDINVLMGCRPASGATHESQEAVQEVEVVIETKSDDGEETGEAIDEFTEAVEDLEAKHIETVARENEAALSQEESEKASSDVEDEASATLEDEQSAREEQSSVMSENFADAQEDVKEESPALKAGDVIQVTVTYVSSPSHFWCQRLDLGTSKDSEKSVSAGPAITEVCEAGATVPETISQGQIYGAKYEDGEWCRVKVLGGDDEEEKNDENEQVCVLFIDFGNCDVVYKSDLRTLPTSLTQKHPSAFLCLLHGVTDSNGEGNWSQVASIYFEEQVTEKKLVAKIVDVAKEYHIVALLDMGLSIADRLIKEGVAMPSDVPSFETSEIEDDSKSSETASPEKSENYTYRDLDQAKSTLLFIADDDDSDREDNEPEQIELEETTLTVGERAEVMISHIDRFDNINVQLNRQVETLDELVEEMQEAYVMAPFCSEEFRATITEGLVCAAHSIIDFTWYRAEVLDVNEDLVTVQYVDYGNVETIPENQLQPLKPKFQAYPKLCVKCQFHGSENLDAKATYEKFVSETAEKTLLAHVTSFNGNVPNIRLLDMGTDVYSKLVPVMADIENNEISDNVTRDKEEASEKTENKEIRAFSEQDEALISSEEDASDIQEVDKHDNLPTEADAADQNGVAVESDTHELSLVSDVVIVEEEITTIITSTDENVRGSMLVDGPKDKGQVSRDEGEGQLHENQGQVSQDEHQICEDKGQIPVDEDQLPVDEAQIPVDEDQLPVDEDQIPVGEEQIPVDEDQIPEDEDQTLVDQAQLPVDEEQIPVDQAQLPIDEDQIPVDEDQLPVDEDQIPVDQGQLPVDQGQIPVDEDQIPVDEDQLLEPAISEIEADINIHSVPCADLSIGDGNEEEAENLHSRTDEVLCGEGEAVGNKRTPYEHENRSEMLQDVGESALDIVNKQLTEIITKVTENLVGGEKAKCVANDDEVYISEEEQDENKHSSTNDNDLFQSDEETVSATPVKESLPERNAANSDEPSPQGKESPRKATVESDYVESTEWSEILSYNFAHFTEGQEMIVTNSVAKSPSHFWCQLEEESRRDLPLLMDRIQDYCSSNSQELVVKHAQPDMVCFAKCTRDGNWYRALVTELDENKDSVKVHYVDYGNSEKLQMSKLRKVTQEFLNLAPQAFSCELIGVLPIMDGDWDETSCARFEELVADYDLNLTVVSKSAGNIAGSEHLKVTLGYRDGFFKSPNTTTPDDIAEILLAGGYAQSEEQAKERKTLAKSVSTERLSFEPETLLDGRLCGIPAPSEFELLLKEPLEAANVLSDDNEEAEFGADETGLILRCKLAGIESDAWTDEACAFFRGFMSCPNLSARVTDVESDNTHLVYLYDLDDDSGTSINYQLVSRDFAWVLPDSELLNLDESNAEELICQQEGLAESSFLEYNEERRQSLGELGEAEDDVSADESDDQDEVLSYKPPMLSVGETLEVTYLSARDPETLICQLTATQTELDSLTKQLEDFFSQGGDGESLTMNQLHSGDACLVYTVDEWRLRRAKVLAKEGDDRVAVHYVDYGEVATVPTKNLRSINRTAVQLPIVAVTCRPKKVQPADEKWTDEAIVSVAEWCAGERLSVTVSSVEADGSVVGSIKISDKEDLVEMLVRKGFAKRQLGEEEESRDDCTRNNMSGVTKDGDVNTTNTTEDASVNESGDNKVLHEEISDDDIEEKDKSTTE